MPTVTEVPLKEITSLRDVLRAEASCQIVHDSLFDRRGWCLQYLLKVGDAHAGFAGVAVGGPWKGHRTVFEFYVLRDWRDQWPELWTRFVESSRIDSYELQTNLPLMQDLIGRLPGPQRVDRVVYSEGQLTTLPSQGARLRQLTSVKETRLCMEERAGQCEWALELDGAKVGRGALLFHYNVPYADIDMEIHEPFRRRGLGAYLVQELKRSARELGAIPAARTNHDNIASQQTLQKAGLVRSGEILTGRVN